MRGALRTRGHAPDGDRLARLWPLVWVVWLPFLAQPVAALLHAHPAPAPPRLITVLAGVATFVAVYLWAAWHNDVSRPAAATGATGALWLPVVALTALGLTLILSDGPGWLELFVFASATAGARRPRGEAAVAVATLTLLTAATGWLTGAAGTSLGQTVFLVGVVGAMVIGLGWTVAAGRAPGAAGAEGEPAPGDAGAIRTPDQRLRVFVSSTLEELATERDAAQAAIASLHLTPVLFELGARPHPPQALYRAYLAQSDIFVGIYWQRYGWVAPAMGISGLEDEYRLAADKLKLIYVKGPAPAREPRLGALLDRIRDDNLASYKPFTTADQLPSLIENDLALLLSERFVGATAAPAPRPADRRPTRRGTDGAGVTTVVGATAPAVPVAPVAPVAPFVSSEE